MTIYDSIQEACRLMAAGDTWGAMEELRRAAADKGHSEEAQTISEYQSEVKKPW
jgi:hypothetical protein